MCAISNYRDHRGSKMRILIFSAFLAYAAAAPSGSLAPVAIPAVAYSATWPLPTVSPGDIQAAVIDAQVKAHDQAIAATDKARELTDWTVQNHNARVLSSNDQVREQAEQQLWSAEDKKWQELDALRTAEAQYDGSVARSADMWSQNAIRSYLAVAPVAIAPVAPISHISVTPGIITPVVKTATAEVKDEKLEAVVKSAESPEKTDSVVIEAKSGEKANELKNQEAKPLAASVIPAPLIAQQYSYPITAPIVPPVLQYSAAVPYGVQTGGLVPQAWVAPGLAPTVLNTPVYNTVW